MKLKKQLYWVGIGAVLVLVLALFVFAILPDWMSTIPDKKDELAKARQELDSYAARPFETLTMLDNHRTMLNDLKNAGELLTRDLFNRNRGLFMGLSDTCPKPDAPRSDAEFRKIYGGQDTQFKQNYGTTYGNMLDSLKNPKSALKLKMERGSDGSDVLRNYKNETPENIIRKFNIQRAIVNACAESGVSAIEFVRINEADGWLSLLGQEKGETPRAIGEIPTKPVSEDEESGKPGARPLDTYYTTIRVAFAVEIKFSKLAALMEAMEKAPVLFRFFAMDASKYDLKQKQNLSTVTFPAGATWKVVRDGEEVETAPLALKFSDVWNEAEAASVLPKRAEFGEHSETKKVVIPESREMIEEPPVRAIFLYEALEFAPPKDGSGK